MKKSIAAIAAAAMCAVTMTNVLSASAAQRVKLSPKDKFNISSGSDSDPEEENDDEIEEALNLDAQAWLEAEREFWKEHCGMGAENNDSEEQDDDDTFDFIGRSKQNWDIIWQKRLHDDMKRLERTIKHDVIFRH
ncbi:MAG: hypothetical protein K6G33_02900 [Ruminococcus sp.]|uniref:hypothetical protein n=1 Tax=Ruminococcus sp. TaxID=41978 RepID=UPI0025D49E04|nr:hypothetical protein [Ruminococcus sp.]MCR5599678.1 hypothetical protein [Ruminococcus sp.]